MDLCEWQASMCAQRHLCECQACVPIAHANAACMHLLAHGSHEWDAHMHICPPFPQLGSKRLKAQQWAAARVLGTPALRLCKDNAVGDRCSQKDVLHLKQMQYTMFSRK